MAQLPMQEGAVPFQLPDKQDVTCATYYKVFGDLRSGPPPVVIVHHLPMQDSLGR